MAIQYRDKTALVTGASSGLGEEFARQLAGRGANLVLVARREDRLTSIADEISKQTGVKVVVIGHDLSNPESAMELCKKLAAKGIEVDILVNNAGFATNKTVASEDQILVRDEIQLNVGTLVELTIGLLPAMKAKKFGVIVNIASTAAYQPVPNMAVYAATKSFVLSFTEALWGELQGSGVKALALSPGATVSEFWEVAKIDTSDSKKFEEPSDVVARAMVELDKRESRPSVVSGRRNRIVASAVKFLPKRVVIKTAGKLFQPSEK